MRAVLRRGAALLKFREVFPGVVVIVAILIYLEQTGDILIGFFTIRRSIRIKQIAQRSLFTVAADRIAGYRQTATLQKLYRKRSGRVHAGVFGFRMI